MHFMWGVLCVYSWPTSGEMEEDGVASSGWVL